MYLLLPVCLYVLDFFVCVTDILECIPRIIMPLHWRHNDRDGVSNHQPHDCLLNCLFSRRSKKTSKLRVTGLCVGWPVNSKKTSKLRVTGLCVGWPVNSLHKGPVTRKMFPFDDVIMPTVRVLLCFVVFRYRSILPISFVIASSSPQGNRVRLHQCHWNNPFGYG